MRIWIIMCQDFADPLPRIWWKGSTSQSQIGEILAIALLNNAFLTNTMLRINGMADEKSKGTMHAEKRLTLTLEEPHRISLSTRKHVISIAWASVSSSRTKRIFTTNFTVLFNDMCWDGEFIFDNIKKLNGTQDVAKTITCYDRRRILSLDDELGVPRSPAHTTNGCKPPITKARFESVVDHKVRSFFGSHEAGNREERNTNSSKNRTSNWKKHETHRNDGGSYRCNRDSKRKKSTILGGSEKLAWTVVRMTMNAVIGSFSILALPILRTQKPNIATTKISWVLECE